MPAAEPGQLLQPDWDLPPTVQARQTTRYGGYSLAPYDSWNLGSHVGDDPNAVAANRARLQDRLGAVAIQWLDQVHGLAVVAVESEPVSPAPAADAAWTTAPRVALAIMTADCLPVLLCSRRGDLVAAAHCGWRGLTGGLLGRLLAGIPEPASQMQAWLGPAISQPNYEVGPDVWEPVQEAFAAAGDRALLSRVLHPVPDAAEKRLLDLAGMARWQLQAEGVGHVAGGQDCAYADPRFYSHRRAQRAGTETGRMASLIWRG